MELLFEEFASYGPPSSAVKKQYLDTYFAMFRRTDGCTVRSGLKLFVYDAFSHVAVLYTRCLPRPFSTKEFLKHGQIALNLKITRAATSENVPSNVHPAKIQIRLRECAV